MQNDWLKIKSCFTQMSAAPDQMPTGCKNRRELAVKAARVMKPRADSMVIRRLASRIMFVAFGE